MNPARATDAIIQENNIRASAERISSLPVPRMQILSGLQTYIERQV